MGTERADPTLGYVLDSTLFQPSHQAGHCFWWTLFKYKKISGEPSIEFIVKFQPSKGHPLRRWETNHLLSLAVSKPLLFDDNACKILGLKHLSNSVSVSLGNRLRISPIRCTEVCYARFIRSQPEQRRVLDLGLYNLEANGYQSE